VRRLFVNTNTPPVHLDVGRVLKPASSLAARGIQSATSPALTNGLRVGLYDHFDAGIRLSGDGNRLRTRVNVRGYMLVQDWETVFNADEPQSLSARTTWPMRA